MEPQNYQPPKKNVDCNNIKDWYGDVCDMVKNIRAHQLNKAKGALSFADYKCPILTESDSSDDYFNTYENYATKLENCATNRQNHYIHCIAKGNVPEDEGHRYARLLFNEMALECRANIEKARPTHAEEAVRRKMEDLTFSPGETDDEIYEQQMKELKKQWDLEDFARKQASQTLNIKPKITPLPTHHQQQREKAVEAARAAEAAKAKKLEELKEIESEASKMQAPIVVPNVPPPSQPMYNTIEGIIDFLKWFNNHYSNNLLNNAAADILEPQLNLIGLNSMFLFDGRQPDKHPTQIQTFLTLIHLLASVTDSIYDKSEKINKIVLAFLYKLTSILAETRNDMIPFMIDFILRLDKKRKRNEKFPFDVLIWEINILYEIVKSIRNEDISLIQDKYIDLYQKSVLEQSNFANKLREDMNTKAYSAGKKPIPEHIKSMAIQSSLEANLYENVLKLLKYWPIIRTYYIIKRDMLQVLNNVPDVLKSSLQEIKNIKNIVQSRNAQISKTFKARKFALPQLKLQTLEQHKMQKETNFNWLENYEDFFNGLPLPPNAKKIIQQYYEPLFK